MFNSGLSNYDIHCIYREFKEQEELDKIESLSKDYSLEAGRELYNLLEEKEREEREDRAHDSACKRAWEKNHTAMRLYGGKLHNAGPCSWQYKMDSCKGVENRLRNGVVEQIQYGLGIVSPIWIGPYDKVKAEMKRKGFSEINLAENAALIIEEHKRDIKDIGEEYVSRTTNGVKEDVIHIPGKGIFLTKVSHISANHRKATNCHRHLDEFYLTPKQTEEALSDSVMLGDTLREECINISIPTNRLSENEIAVYAFGGEKCAEQYGRFLNEECNVAEMKIECYLPYKRDKPFARKVLFCLNYLKCDYRSLHSSYTLRGLPESANAPKSLESQLYTALMTTWSKARNL